MATVGVKGLIEIYCNNYFSTGQTWQGSQRITSTEPTMYLAQRDDNNSERARSADHLPACC